MNPEELKKILENAEMSLEDKLKAVTDLYEAAAKGLILKRDELLGEQKKLKDEKKALEESLAGTGSRITELETELKKNSPEERQKYYDAKLQELEARHKTDVEAVSAERDKYKQAHIARIRDEAVANGIKELKLIPAYKEAYIARVMALNNFKMVEIDGNSVFVNEANKTIDAVMREFALSVEGKAFIENQNSGGGSNPNTGQAGTGAGAGGQATREQFASMSPAARLEFINKGGTVVNP